MKRLQVFDFDGVIINSPLPEEGKKQWEAKHGKPFPYLGWWSKIESLDMNTFDIKPFPTILNQLNKEKSKPDTYVIVLTSRLEKLRPQVQAILDANNIIVNELIMKNDNRTKGDIILEYINKFPDLKEISVYDDRENEIEGYMNVSNKIPDNILFNIYKVNNDKISLIERENNLTKIIKEEISKFSKINEQFDSPNISII